MDECTAASLVSDHVLTLNDWGTSETYSAEGSQLMFATGQPSDGLQFRVADFFACAPTASKAEAESYLRDEREADADG